MGEIYDEDCDVIVLTDEEGKDHEFELIEILEVADKEYAILVPLGGEDSEDDEADDEAIILRVETDDTGERVFSDIDDDEEWERVAEVWESSLDEEYDDLDDEEDDEEEDEEG